MTHRTRSFRFLFALLLLKTVSQVLLYRHGLLSLSADEYARGIVAATWAANPRIDLLADLQAVWLPLEKYLNGLALIVWPDVILAPRLTVFLASCVTLVMFFLLTRRLFADFAIAALSTLLVALLPWFAWLSGTPMLEMYFFACFFAGLFFLVVWLQEERRAAWLWAGACFLLASGFHVQSWPLINLVNLLTLPFLWRFARQRAWRRALRLLGFYLLGNALILGFTLLEFALTGELFAFLSSHTAYSLWYYGGYDVPPLEKFLYYPRQIVDNAHAGYWLGLPIALLFLWRDPNRGWKLLPLALTAVSLLLFSSMNVLSGPPSAAPARYSLFYLMLLTPYLA
ncbi:MAG: hypothetical protein KC425_25205, partial [Anaerolineales bacterium]|nr:hypothetical protein [Anaerolineales bacterium]